MYTKTKTLLIVITVLISLSSSNAFAVAVQSLSITDWNMQTGGSITYTWSLQQSNMPVIMGQYQGTPNLNNTLGSGILGGTTTIFGNTWEFGAMTANGTDYGLSSTAAPSGNVVNEILTLDLQSWMIFFVNTSDPQPTLQIDSAGSYPVTSISTQKMQASFMIG